MGKIKVAFFSDLMIRDFDGATRTMYQILDRIPKDEFEYLFFCGVKPTHQVDFEVVQLPTVKIPRNHTYRMAIIHLSKGKVRKKLDEFAPDVIQFTSPSQISVFGSKYAKEKNIPLVTIYHTHFISYMKYYFSFAPFLIPTVNKIVAKTCKNIYDPPDIVYVPTEEIKRQLLTKCNLRGDNIRIWARGLNQERFDPNKRDPDILRTMTKNDKPNIIYASRLVMEKNLDVLVKFYQKNQKEGSPFNLIIVGYGAAKEKMMKKMPYAFFLGKKNQEELAAVYASCDVFFFPSTTETFGNVIPEAMASGLPCVLSNEGGHRSYVEHESNALLCPPDDVDAYWKAIHRVLDDAPLREKMIRKGLEFTKTLNWEELVERYFEDLRVLTQAKK